MALTTAHIDWINSCIAEADSVKVVWDDPEGSHTLTIGLDAPAGPIYHDPHASVPIPFMFNGKRNGN